MHRKQQGMVLIIILIFFLVSELIGFYLIESSRLMLQKSHEALNNYKRRVLAEQVLDEVEKEVVNGKSDGKRECFISIVSANNVSKSFSHFCHYRIKMAHAEFYYAIEHLQDDPCANIEYDRITVRAISQADQVGILLQTIVAVNHLQKMDCKKPRHFIKPGRKIWREL